MQNEEKSTQFTMESCHVCFLLAFSIRIPSHTPKSGHLLLESNMAARYNSFAYTKNRVSRLQGFTNREIKVIILYLRNRRLWRSSTENLRIRTPISFRLCRPPQTSIVVGPPYLAPTEAICQPWTVQIRIILVSWIYKEILVYC